MFLYGNSIEYGKASFSGYLDFDGLQPYPSKILFYTYLIWGLQYARKKRLLKSVED